MNRRRATVDPTKTLAERVLERRARNHAELDQRREERLESPEPLEKPEWVPAEPTPAPRRRFPRLTLR